MSRAEIVPFSLPLREPFATADGRITERSGFLFRVPAADAGDDRGGAVGEATPLPGWTEPREACRGALDAAAAALPEGFDAAVEATEGRPAARHAVVQARLDRAARAAGVPLYRHLGAGRRVERVPANATVGDAAPAATAEAAREAVEAGFDCVKVKVGARPVETDAERLDRVRGAVGERAGLRADANGAWTRAGARDAFAAFAERGVAYVEQPLPAADLDGLAALRGSEVGVAADETLRERTPAEVLEAGACDVLVVKPMVLGGIDRAHRAARRAREAGVTPVVTTTVDGAVARAAAVHLAAAIDAGVPCGLATGAMLAADFPDPAPVVDGAARVPRTPGVGVAADATVEASPR